MTARKNHKLRVLDGGADRRPDKNPQQAGTKDAADALKNPPRVLDKDGRKYWREIVPQIGRMGILHRVDRAALIMVCSAYSLWIRALEKCGDEITVDGVVEKSHKRNPALVQADIAAARFRQLLGDFGLTPKARLTLGVLEPDESGADDFESLL